MPCLTHPVWNSCCQVKLGFIRHDKLLYTGAGIHRTPAQAKHTYTHNLIVSQPLYTPTGHRRMTILTILFLSILFIFLHTSFMNTPLGENRHAPNACPDRRISLVVHYVIFNMIGWFTESPEDVYMVYNVICNQPIMLKTT